jgi:hypothetical protein
LDPKQPSILEIALIQQPPSEAIVRGLMVYSHDKLPLFQPKMTSWKIDVEGKIESKLELEHWVGVVCKTSNQEATKKDQKAPSR